MKHLLFLLALTGATSSMSNKLENIHLVAEDNCGVRGKQPHRVEGESYRFNAASGIPKAALSCSFGEQVVYVFEGMDIQADYSLKLTFYSDPTDAKRVMKVLSDTSELATIELEPGQLVEKEIDLPGFAYAYGKMRLVIAKEEGANALVSTIKVYSSKPKKLQAEQAAVVAAAFDYDTVPVPAPTYAPFPEATTGVASPVMSLSGEWNFNPAPDKGFPSQKGGTWETIQVPGHWATQGFAVEDGTHAGYMREFDLPSDWTGKHIRLRFDSVFSDCMVYVNEQEAGRHLGTFTAFELDITDHLKPGRNTLELKVRNDSMADNLGSLNQYANFPLGGILRKVTLFALPPLHITDLRIATEFDSAFKDAKLNLQFEVANTTDAASKNAEISVHVPGAIKAQTIQIPEIKPGMTRVVSASIPVTSPKQWDNEHPNLYDLECQLRLNEKTLEKISKRFGFRQVEVRGNRMLVNGKPIKLAGVCRHEAHPLLGRALTREQWRKDAELYMTGNVNFIRTSHYPPAEEFIEACDELGLFVELEAPVCWVGHHANKSWKKLNYRDPKWYPYMLQANIETIRFHRNNPSIILWSLANESCWSDNFATILEHVQEEDPTRPHAFHDQDYGGFNNHGSTAPVANIHYPGPNGAEAVKGYERPITFGEFCHLNVYNRQELVADPGIRNTWGHCLDRIWNKMYATDACLGGSIWSGIDDLFLLPDGQAVGYGAWGPIDGWRRPKPEYFYMKKVYSPIRVMTPELEAGRVAELTVANRHSFTNVKELTIKWQVGNRSGGATTDIAPHSTGTLRIETLLDDGEELCVAFHSAKGYLIDQFDIPVGTPLPAPSTKAIAGERITMKENVREYLLKGTAFTCTINKETGQITSIEKDGKTVVSDGVHLVISDLKGSGCYPNHSADTPAWDPLCSNWKATEVEAKASANSVEITVKGKYAEAEGRFVYTINGNGVFKIDYDFTTLRKVDPRQIGLALNLADRFDSVAWERTSDFTGFPLEHIGRLKGSAPAFYGEKPDYPIDENGNVKRQFIRQQPEHPWSHDCNELGSSDFRGTRTQILYYKMSAPNGDTVTLLSDGTQAGRCRMDGEKVRLYCIDVDTGGAELFLGSHLQYLRNPLKKGDRVTGEMTFQIK
ncbi:MAG: glycoside hydrolase family 2 [Verrucomicrobia bacterium]|nr:glycoside hydrolase family 2 [Verrucomicrobiota bacterium]